MRIQPYLVLALSMATCTGCGMSTQESVPEPESALEAEFVQDRESFGTENSVTVAQSTVTSFSTFYRGTSPHNPLEVAGEILDGYMLTGIGGRIKSGSNFTTLRLRGQAISIDGSLGQEYDWNFGSAPNNELEVLYEVPPGYAIVGLGMRERHGNLATLVVYYRQYDQALRRLVGNVYTARAGSAPNGPIEAQFGTWEEQSTLGDVDKFVIKGVGLRAHRDQVTTLQVTVGRINI